MEEIGEDPTLAELVSTRRGAARVLERHGLDYCCGGAQHLRAACADEGVDADDVLEDLTALAPGPHPEWALLDPAALVDHIEATHHRYLHEEMPRLSALAAKVAGVHGGRHPELALVEATYDELRADLEPHLRREEQVLFPMIRWLHGAAERPAMGPAEPDGPISVMVADHDRAGVLLAQLRSLTQGYTVPEDGCASYRALLEGLADLEADTHLHVHKENNVLFPVVLGRGQTLDGDA
ncbi:MAG: iron-sulfur cluster repair di-iron protein [Acidimicrobiales bacterium]|nr:iron-sulfur cluster repair di-iron protein [Acidimicrobiales bacterium]